MDTGLNNKNTLHLALEEKMLEDVEWLVEANSNEVMELWEKWSTQSMTNFSPLYIDRKEFMKSVSNESSVIEKLLDLNEKVKRVALKRKEWVQINQGHGFTILTLQCSIPGKRKKEKLPIVVNFRYFVIGGHKVAFYSCDSALNHRFYVEAFLKTYFQRTHDKYSRWNHTDAQNFHNCINYLETIDKDPRDTVYKPDGFMKNYFIFEPTK